MKMVSGIPECQEKYLLKLTIQQDIINTHLSINRANNAQGSLPLTSTNYPYLYYIVGSFFLRRQMTASLQVF